MPLTTNAKEAEVEWFYEDPQDLELTPKKVVLFIIRDGNTKVGSQEIPGLQLSLALEYKSRSKANRVLPRECTGHSKHLLPAMQEMTRVNIDILGISELRWTGTGELNSDDCYLLLWAGIP